MIETRRVHLPEDASLLQEMVYLASIEGDPSPRSREAILVDPDVTPHLPSGPEDRAFGGVVATVDGQPAGAAWYNLISNEHYHGPQGEVVPVVIAGVRPEFQGRGLGRTLVTALQQVAVEDGLAGLVLKVREQSNPRASRLYATTGFQVESLSAKGVADMRWRAPSTGQASRL